MKKFLKNLYQKLQNTKTHLWSHIMALIGWIYITTTILLIWCFQEIFLFYWLVCIPLITFYIFIPSLILAYIEFEHFKTFRMKWNFLTKNPFYNIFWFIGIISIIIYVTFVIIVLSTI